MKKRIFLTILSLTFVSFAYAEEILDEVILDTETTQAVSVTEEFIPDVDKTLREKLYDVYHLEVEQINKPKFLLEDILTKHYAEDSIWEKTQLWGAYYGIEDFSFYEDGPITNHYDPNFINVGYDGYLKNNNGDFRIMLNYSPLSSRNIAQNMFADMYIATNKIPHHRIMIGNTRPPLGIDGASSPYILPFATRSQIGRKFGTVRKLGARISGDYSLVDYDFGLYSSDTYFNEFFPGVEFIGRFDFKPLEKTDGKYGKFVVGTSLDTGNRTNTFCVAGVHAQYDYKKTTATFEWANANGYNGPAGYSSEKHASGFYTTLAYRLTPKVQVLARYDMLNPDKNVSNNNIREYTAGINYFIKGQGLKIIINYVFCQNNAVKDSHRILLGTQILL